MFVPPVSLRQNGTSLRLLAFVITALEFAGLPTLFQ